MTKTIIRYIIAAFAMCTTMPNATAQETEKELTGLFSLVQREYGIYKYRRINQIRIYGEKEQAFIVQNERNTNIIVQPKFDAKRPIMNYDGDSYTTKYSDDKADIQDAQCGQQFTEIWKRNAVETENKEILKLLLTQPDSSMKIQGVWELSMRITKDGKKETVTQQDTVTAGTTFNIFGETTMYGPFKNAYYMILQTKADSSDNLRFESYFNIVEYENNKMSLHFDFDKVAYDTEFINDSTLHLSIKNNDGQKIYVYKRSSLPQRLQAVLNHIDKNAIKKAENEEFVYKVVQKQPEFPGGMKALMQYLKEKIVYPIEDRENNFQGKSYIKFVIHTDGSISDVRVERSSGSKSLDREAIRVVQMMPKWKPGTQSGKPVNVEFTLPVTFRLQ